MKEFVSLICAMFCAAFLLSGAGFIFGGVVALWRLDFGLGAVCIGGGILLLGMAHMVSEIMGRLLR